MSTLLSMHGPAAGLYGWVPRKGGVERSDFFWSWKLAFRPVSWWEAQEIELFEISQISPIDVSPVATHGSRPLCSCDASVVAVRLYIQELFV